VQHRQRQLLESNNEQEATTRRGTLDESARHRQRTLGVRARRLRVLVSGVRYPIAVVAEASEEGGGVA
jgi:hypothetical protein